MKYVSWIDLGNPIYVLWNMLRNVYLDQGSPRVVYNLCPRIYLDVLICYWWGMINDVANNIIGYMLVLRQY